MKIIIKGEDTRKKCNSCKCVLEFVREDVKIEKIQDFSFRYIECPICHNQIKIG